MGLYTSLHMFLQGIYLDAVTLLRYVDPVSVAVCFFVTGSVFALLEKGITARHRVESVVVVLFESLYATLLMAITVLGRSGLVVADDRVVLFNTFREALGGNEAMQFDILYNVFLFIPIGMIVARYSSRVVGVCVIFGVTLLIESTQLLLHRGVFECSDIVSNCVGGIIGMALVHAVGEAIARMRSR